MDDFGVQHDPDPTGGPSQRIAEREQRPGGSISKWLAGLAIVAVLGIVAALLLPVKTTVQYQTQELGETALITETHELTIACGTPLRNGPATVSQGATFFEDPCADALGTRRRILVTLGLIALAAGAVAIYQARSRTGPAPRSDAKL